MQKYIDSEKLIAEIQKRIEETKSMKPSFDQFWAGQISAFKGCLNLIDSLQQEQPIEGKQVVIITETDGDANIHWDCRSLDDVKALLASAQSFIADKQVEELRGMGSGPDYNTTEGRFRKAHEFKQEQPEVDIEKEIDAIWNPRFNLGWDEHSALSMNHAGFASIARHFFALGLNARKEA